MFRFGMGELIIILLIVLVLFGAAKLPEIGRALGKAIKEFKKAGKDVKDDIEEVTKEDEKK
ncbi:MAG: twin-arginine translocase TatA/TatE family subunit [Candidatus Omnitrophica bacterium]|nr:twin-arginine translocase TatA/TatE family subunit [Candidatus Omnitrophota bacterium]